MTSPTASPTWEVAAQIAVARHRGTLDRDDALQDARLAARRAARLRMVPLRVEVATVDRHPGLEAAAVDAAIAELGAGPREAAGLWRLAYDAA